MRILFILILGSFAHLAIGQYQIIGFVYDQAEVAFAGVEVRLTGGEETMVTQTDPEGRFEFHDIPRGEYAVLVLTEYGMIERKINLRTSLEMHLQRARNIRMDEITVKGVRSDKNSPIPITYLDEEEIQNRNLGQDVPFALKWTPSVVTTSDAGTGIGYTGIRIRGTDPTRINVTINGVPLNDAESQAVFWVDLPDLLSSTESIQIQRGVGESTFGTGAFGASINLNTTKTHTRPYGKVTGSLGSFNTYRASAQFGTGLIGNHFSLDGRIGLIKSDGYIDRATADLKSFYATAAYISGKTSVRFTSFGGAEETYQAWYGVPAQYIDDPELRTYNAAGTEKSGEPYDNEVDDYTQTHYQLHVNRQIFTQLDGSLTFHYTKGKGYFEQYKSPEYFEPSFAEFLAGYGLENSDAIRRRWLDNDFYGFIAGIYFDDPSEKFTFRLSGGYNRYLGNHFGEVIWSGTGLETSELPYYYDNDADKKVGNIFGKLNYKINQQWRFFVDLQYRSVNYSFQGPNAQGVPTDQNVELKFFNPKAGVLFSPAEGLSFQYFAGLANREPNRDDYVSSSELSRPEPERLFDNELLVRYTREKVSVEAVGYYMLYKDQLALTGRINDVGEYTRENVDNSYRLGLELNAEYRPVDVLKIGVSSTLSQNRITEFTEYIDDWDTGGQIPVVHEDVPLSFSPSTLLMGYAGYRFLNKGKHTASIGFQTKYVGEQHIDNTGNETSVLDSYSFTDLNFNYDFKLSEARSISLNVLVRNIFDAKYSTNAWNYRFKSAGYNPIPDDPYAEFEIGDIYHLQGYFPQAGTNVLASLTLAF